ncbi:MAG: lysostaphin resistance A-like protein [Saprospiraceae bacterium]
MSSKVFISIATIIIFLIADNNFDILQTVGVEITREYRYLVYITLSLILGLLGSVLLFGKQALQRLGMQDGMAKGLGYGLLFTLPMFVGYAFIGEWRTDFTALDLLSTLIGATMEEVVYRGVLFGFLYRFAGWKFLPAVLLNALIFASAHLYQGSGLEQTMGIFAVTLTGGLWFAWLYIKWDNNLWIAIGLHFFMNLSWGVFAVGDTALGGWGANVFRIMTIVLSIVYTKAVLARQQEVEQEKEPNLQAVLG